MLVIEEKWGCEVLDDHEENLVEYWIKSQRSQFTDNDSESMKSTDNRQSYKMRIKTQLRETGSIRKWKKKSVTKETRTRN